MFWHRKLAYYDRRPGMQWRDLDDVDTMAYPLWSSEDSSYDNWRLNGLTSIAKET